MQPQENRKEKTLHFISSAYLQLGACRGKCDKDCANIYEIVTLALTSHSTPSTRDLAHVPHSLGDWPPMPTGTLSYSLGLPSDVCGVSESLLLQVPGLV